jgi:hypothetical protein
VHDLEPKHKQNRKTNCRKLYENHLAADRGEYIVTLDEAWVDLHYCIGERRICYVKRGEMTDEIWLKYCTESWLQGFIIIDAVSGRGILPLIKVTSTVKINANYYIKHVLKPILE